MSIEMIVWSFIVLIFLNIIGVICAVTDADRKLETAKARRKAKRMARKAEREVKSKKPFNMRKR